MKKIASILMLTALFFGCKEDEGAGLNLKLETAQVKEISSEGAVCGGTFDKLNSLYPVDVVGVCWGEKPDPWPWDTSHMTIDKLHGKSFVSTITGLDIGKTYYVRAFALSNIRQSIIFGNTLSFTTEKKLPTVTTSKITGYISTGIKCGGIITYDGGGITACGVCWSESPDPDVSLSTKTVDTPTSGVFTSAITGLVPGKTYYFRAYATNEKGTAYGERFNLTGEGYESATSTIYTGVAERLSELLSSRSRDTITVLKIVGKINYVDFSYLKNMPALAILDLGDAECNAIYGFKRKTSLRSVILPQSLVKIGGNAFSECSGLTGTLTIPNGVKTIGDHAFSGCTGLTGNLTIPNGVTEIEDYAFSGCSGLTGSLTIPNGVKIIEEYAFDGCTGFRNTLTIGSGVTQIKESAFQNCYNFTNIISLAQTPPFLWHTNAIEALYNKPLRVPAGRANAYKAAPIWKNFTTITE